MNSQVFPLGKVSIDAALRNRACCIFLGGLMFSLEGEELAAGQEHVFGDKAVGRCCWEGG